MHENCQPESSAAAAGGLQLAVNALAEFPTRAGFVDLGVAGRLAAVAEPCKAVAGALDSGRHARPERALATVGAQR